MSPSSPPTSQKNGEAVSAAFRGTDNDTIGSTNGAAVNAAVFPAEHAAIDAAINATVGATHSSTVTGHPNYSETIVPAHHGYHELVRSLFARRLECIDESCRW